MSTQGYSASGYEFDNMTTWSVRVDHATVSTPDRDTTQSYNQQQTQEYRPQQGTYYTSEHINITGYTGDNNSANQTTQSQDNLADKGAINNYGNYHKQEESLSANYTQPVDNRQVHQQFDSRDQTRYNQYSNQQQNTYQDNSYQKPTNEVNSNVGIQSADLNQGNSSNSHLTQTNVIIHETTINNSQVADSGEVSPPLKSLDVTANDKLWKRDVTAPGVSDSESEHSASSQDTMIMINTNDGPVIDSNNTPSHTSEVYQSSGVPYSSGYHSSIVNSSQSSHRSREEVNNELNRSNLHGDEHINTDYKIPENSTSGSTKPGDITESYSTGDQKQVLSSSTSESENSSVNMNYNSTSYTSQSLTTRHPQAAGYVNSGGNSYRGGYEGTNGGRTVQQANSQYWEDKQFSSYPNVQATPSSTPSNLNQTASNSPVRNIGVSPGKGSNRIDSNVRDSPSDKKSVSKSGSYAVRSTRSEYNSPQRDQTSVNTAMNESIESIKSGLNDGIPVNMVVIEPKQNTGILSYKGKYPDKPKKTVTWDLPETTRNVKPTLISKLFKSSGDKKSKSDDKGNVSPVPSPTKPETVTTTAPPKATSEPPAIKTAHGYVAQHQIPSFKEMNQALKKSLEKKFESDTPEEFSIEGIQPLENTEKDPTPERDQAPVQIIHTKNQKPLDGISEPDYSNQKENFAGSVADSVQTSDNISQHSSNNTVGYKSILKQPSGEVNTPVSESVEPRSPLKDWKPLNVGAIIGKPDQEITQQNTTRVTFNEAPQGENNTQTPQKENANTPGQPVSNNKPAPKPKPPIISAKPALKAKPVIKHSGTSGQHQQNHESSQLSNIENPAEIFQHGVNSGSSGPKDQSINAHTQETITTTSTAVNNTINVSQSYKRDINIDKSQYENANSDLPPPPDSWNESTIRYEMKQGRDNSPQPQSMPAPPVSSTPGASTPAPSTPGAPQYVTPASPYSRGSTSSYQYKGPEENIPYPAYSFKEDLPSTDNTYQSNSYSKSTPVYHEEPKQSPQIQQQALDKQQKPDDDTSTKRAQPSSVHPPTPAYKPTTSTSAAAKPPTTPKPSAYERLMLNSPYAKKATPPQNKSSPPSTKPPSPLTTGPAPKASPQGSSPSNQAPAGPQGASVYSGYRPQQPAGNYEQHNIPSTGNLRQPQYTSPSQTQSSPYTSSPQGPPQQAAYERTRPSSAMGNLVKQDPYNRSSPTIDQSTARQGALYPPAQDRVRSVSPMSNLMKQAPHSRSSPSIDSLSGRESPYSNSGDIRPPSALDNLTKHAPYARSSPSLDSQQGDRGATYGTVPYERNRPASASYATPHSSTLERHPSSASNTSGSTLTGSYTGMPEGQYNSMYDLPKHNTGEFNAPRSQSTIELPNTGDYGYNDKNRWSDMSYTSDMSLNYPQDDQRGNKSQTPTPTPTETSSISSDTSKTSNKPDKQDKGDKNKDPKDPFVRGNKSRWSGKFRLSKRSKKKKAELAEKQAQMAAELEKRAKEKEEQQKPKDCEYQGFAFALDPVTGMMVIKAKEEPKPKTDNKEQFNSRNQSDRSDAGLQQSSQGMGPPPSNDNPLTISIPGQANPAYRYPNSQHENVYEPVNIQAQTGVGGYDSVDTKQETKQQKPVTPGGKLQDGMLVEERGVPEGASSSPGSSMDNVSVPSNSPAAATNIKQQAQLDSYNKQIAEHLQYSSNKPPTGGKSQDVSSNLNPPSVYHYGQPNTYHANSPKEQSPGYSPQQNSPQYPVHGQGPSQYTPQGQGSSQHPYSYTNQQGSYQYNNQGPSQYSDPRSYQYSTYQNKLPNQDKTQSELVGPYNTQNRTNAPLEANQGPYRNSYSTYQAPTNNY